MVQIDVEKLIKRIKEWDDELIDDARCWIMIKSYLTAYLDISMEEK